MPNAINSNTAYLQLLATTQSVEQRQALLDTATPGQVRAISEATLNLLHKRTDLPSSAAAVKKLKDNSEFLRTLATAERSVARKKRLLADRHQHEIATNQTGESIFSILLPILVGTVLPALFALFGGKK